MKKAPLLDHVASPRQSETPLERLRESHTTDKSLLYVRNNVDLANMTLQPVPAEGWRVEIGGLLEHPLTLEVADLLERPHVDVEMVLQCSGNSRAKFAQVAPALGAQWEHGALANVVFSGVPLKEVLEPCGVQAEATYLNARGRGTLGEDAPPFERSVLLEEVLDNALLATKLNGEPLPGVHGSPVRLVLPGFYGVNNVKWLTHLNLACSPTANLHQSERYRMPLGPIKPGAPFEPTPKNSRPSWRQNLKSLLWSPLPHERISAGKVTLSGPAWTDGQHKVSAVEVSLDRGASWREAALEPPASPYGWSLWTLTLELPEGEVEVWVKATDEAGHTQPLDGRAAWNPDGYEWNAVDKVRLKVSADSD